MLASTSDFCVLNMLHLLLPFVQRSQCYGFSVPHQALPTILYALIRIRCPCQGMAQFYKVDHFLN